MITFTCYGCHLPGSETGSVNRNHRAHGTPLVEANSKWAKDAAERMRQPAYTLDEPRRAIVLEAIREVCAYRGYHLLAAHVRSTHVHVIVEGDVVPEKLLLDFKRYATRRLDEPGRTHWTRHGSTCYLWKREQVSSAMRYVMDEQGAPMSVYQDKRSAR